MPGLNLTKSPVKPETMFVLLEDSKPLRDFGKANYTMFAAASKFGLN